MGFGGPVWHASVYGGSRIDQMEMCMAALRSVGDRRLGEWREKGRAYHVRRRISKAEESGIGPVLDLRRTDEERRRLALLKLVVSPEVYGWAAVEVGA